MCKDTVQRTEWIADFEAHYSALRKLLTGPCRGGKIADVDNPCRQFNECADLLHLIRIKAMDGIGAIKLGRAALE